MASSIAITISSIGQRKLRNLPYHLLLATLAFFVIYPLFLLLLNSFQISPPGETARFSWNGWRTALSDPEVLQALLNSVTLTLTRQIISLPIGILIAWFLARTDLPGKGWLQFLFWVSYFVPSLAVTQGMIMLFDPTFGVLNQLSKGLPFVENSPFNIYSWWGIVSTHLIATTIALKVILLVPAFQNMDASLEEASRVCGVSSAGTVFRIVIPTLAPAIFIALLLSTIRGLEAFEIEMVLGTPGRIDVYSTKIYRLLHLEPPLFGAATALSMAVVGLMLPLIILQRWITTRRRYTTVTGRYRFAHTRLGRWKWFAFFSILAVAFVVSVLPLIFSVAGTFMKLYGFFEIPQPWTLRHWETIFSDPIFLQSLKNTLVLASGCALIAVVVCSGVAYVIARTRYWGNSALDIVSWLPHSLPGIIFGLSLLWLFLGTEFLRPLYGTIFVMILANVLGGMTLGIQIVKSNFMQLAGELEEASWVAGGTRWYTIRRVVFPIFAPVLVSVGLLNFVAAARSVSNVALLAVSSTRPLSLLQLDYMVEGRYEAGSVIGSIVAFICIAVLLLGRILGLRFGIRGEV